MEVAVRLQQLSGLCSAQRLSVPPWHHHSLDLAAHDQAPAELVLFTRLQAEGSIALEHRAYSPKSMRASIDGGPGEGEDLAIRALEHIETRAARHIVRATWSQGQSEEVGLKNAILSPFMAQIPRR